MGSEWAWIAALLLFCILPIAVFGLCMAALQIPGALVRWIDDANDLRPLVLTSLHVGLLAWVSAMLAFPTPIGPHTVLLPFLAIYVAFKGWRQSVRFRR